MGQNRTSFDNLVSQMISNPGGVLSAEEDDALWLLSARNKITKTALVRRALREFIERHHTTLETDK